MQEERSSSHPPIRRTLQGGDEMLFSLQHSDRAFGASGDGLEPRKNIMGELWVCGVDMQIKMAR